jgi:ribosomal protein L16 Arg81 hydroxylase
MQFGELIYPLTEEQFLTNYYGKNYLVVKGQPEKFSHLLSLQSLDRILTYNRLEYPRIRMSKSGEPLPVESYLRTSVSRKGIRASRIFGSGIHSQLEEGATLIVDGVDELSEQVRVFAESIECVLKEKITANAFLGKGKTNGFKTHCDDQDVFVTQIIGRKYWKVYGMSRTFPLSEEIFGGLTPSDELLWEGFLEQGDVLYLPRGWWHLVNSDGNMSCHITFGLGYKTGIDFLDWIKTQLIDEELMRKNIPRFEGTEALLRYTDKIVALLRKKITTEAMLSYFNEHEDQAVPRSYVNLDVLLSNDISLLPDGTWVRLVSERNREMNSQEDFIELTRAGMVFEASPDSFALLHNLLTMSPILLGDLKIIARENQVSKEDFSEFMTALLIQGIIKIEKGM